MPWKVAPAKLFVKLTVVKISVSVPLPPSMLPLKAAVSTKMRSLSAPPAMAPSFGAALDVDLIVARTTVDIVGVKDFEPARSG